MQKSEESPVSHKGTRSLHHERYVKVDFYDLSMKQKLNTKSITSENLQVCTQVLLSRLKLYITSTLGQTHLRRAAVGDRRHICEQPPLCSEHGLSPASSTMPFTLNINTNV